MCQHCGTVFEAYGERTYCSKQCTNMGQVGRKLCTKGIFVPRSKGEYRICPQCHKRWWKPPSVAKSVYCSAACYFAIRWGNGAHRETRKCKVCDVTWECKKSAQRVCCSIECRRILLQTTYLAEKSHLWRGGSAEQDYGKHTGNWNCVRRQALERDGHTCVLCGSPDKLGVHHKIPYRYVMEHRLENLITLCRSCHSKEELKINPLIRKSLGLRWNRRQGRVVLGPT
jgi:5-methylcytosine-specific restriction endonuclease McrA